MNLKKMMNFLMIVILGSTLLSCGSFKAKRVTGDESDETALEITDKWMVRDSEIAVDQIIQQIEAHKGFQAYLRKLGKQPKVFIAEIQNDTSEAYFPIDDFNDEMLNRFSADGDYTLVDAAARERLLKEIQYQNDGMVDPNDAKMVGKQAGADLLIFGAIRMKAESRDGKTVKEYTVNVRMTDLEKGIEVLRVRVRNNKVSAKSSVGW